MGPETGVWSPFLPGDSHTWCQNTLRHYILSQMVTLPPALVPRRQSHICVPVAGPNLVSSFCALHGVSECHHKQISWRWVWSWHTVPLFTKKDFANPTMDVWLFIFFLGHLCRLLTQSRTPVRCVMLWSESGPICRVFKNTPATSSLCSQAVRNDWFWFASMTYTVPRRSSYLKWILFKIETPGWGDERTI